MDMTTPDITPNVSLALSHFSHGQKAENLKEMASKADIARTEKAAREFEAVFISEMLKPMFENISTEAPFGGGKAEEIFRGILLQEYGKQIASTGKIGIADHVQTELLKLQEQNTKQN